MIFTDAELAYLAGQRLGRLATVQPTGQPQASPVGYRWNPATSTIDIGGRNMAASMKFRNIATHPKVAFVVDDVASLDPWTVRCLEIRGWADALHAPADAAYTIGDKAVIRIHPTRIISWGIDPDGPGTRNVPS